METRNPMAKEAFIALIIFIAIIVIRYYVLPMMTHTDVPMAVVEGKSMFPTLREGDIVFAYKPKPQDIKVGDIIIYEFSGRYIIHRVIRVIVEDGRYYYVTKGDNNPYKDTYYLPGVPYDKVKGKVLEVNGVVIKIPYAGYYTLWIYGK